MRMCWVLLAGLLVSQAKLGLAAEADPRPRTYYLDAAAGDDGRDGLKPETAWRSLEKVNRATLRPGDTILLRRGQSWRGQLLPQSGSVAAPVAYGAFGEGPKPLILGSAPMDRPEDWQPAGPASPASPAGDGIWATAPVRIEPTTLQSDLRQARWSLYQEGGAACTWAPLPADAAGPGGYRLECKTSGTASNHIQLIAPGLSVREGEYYLLSFRARCTKTFAPARFSLMKDSAPYTSYASAESASIGPISSDWTEQTVRFRATQTASDARLTLFLGGSIPAGSTLLIQPQKLMAARCNQPIPLSVDVGNIIFDQGQSTGVKKWREADLRQEGDYFYDPRTWQVKLRSNGNPATKHRGIELALNRHIINETNRGYVTYDNLALAYGAAHGIGGSTTHHIIVRDCDIFFIGGGHQLTRPDGQPVRFGNGVEFWSDAHDNLVEGCRLWEVYDAALTDQGSGTNVQANITYRRNVIWNCEYSFEFWNRGPQSHNRNIVFEHNTCVDAGMGWGHSQRPDPNGRHLMFYDNSAVTEGVVIRYNIFCNAADSCLRLHGRDWTAALTMDFNCWFQAQGPLWLWGTDKMNAQQVKAFEQKRGLDAHSLVADPKFLDPAAHDYRLAPDSPARAIQDQGTPPGALP